MNFLGFAGTREYNMKKDNINKAIERALRIIGRARLEKFCVVKELNSL